MGNSTLTNSLSPVTKGSQGLVVAVPDICKTPSPGGPIPIPYPNISKAGDLADGSSNVKVDGQPVCLLGKSTFSTSTGDEAGTAGGGVGSSKTKGPSRPLMGSPDVKIEGKSVVRNLDLFIANGGNTPPAPVLQAQLTPSVPDAHSPDGACPFCPPPKKKNYKTFPGASNNSSKLAKIMGDPDSLTSEQQGARPKDGADEHQLPPIPRPQPKPIFSTTVHGAYSCEAHHAISGNQALKGHQIEDWLIAGKLVDADSGYSVNNTENGVWLPSIPVKFKGGEWGELSYEQKKECAFDAMRAGKGQFHKGPHNIGDPADPTAKYHERYPAALKKELTLLNNEIKAWAASCKCCEGKTPHAVNWKVNAMIDRLSARFIRDLTKPPKSWTYFISKVALDFHKQDCPHCGNGISL